MDNDYERQRQENIRANQELVKSLLGAEGGGAVLGVEKKATPAPKTRKPTKRKATPVKREEGGGSRRTSSRLLGLQADSETLLKRQEAEAAVEREERKKALKARHTPYSLDNLPEPIADLDSLSNALASTFSSDNPKPLGTATANDDEDEGKAGDRAELIKLKEQFEGLEIRSQAKVTDERTFSMVIHPDKTKTLVFAGDKYGQMGIWEPLATPEEDEDADPDELPNGKHWRVQIHGKNSLSCQKIDPSDGKKLYTSSYDCTIRCLDLESQRSVEVFSIRDSDYLISNFDMPREGNEIWATDKRGGLSHCDLREGGSRRRYEVGEGKKLGGVSVNPAHPWLVCTAGNDQHVRIWDVRHLSNLQSLPSSDNPLDPSSSDEDDAAPSPKAAKRERGTSASGSLSPPPAVVPEEEDEIVETWPTANFLGEKVDEYASKAKGKGLVQGAYRHGKSCSSAVWDPWGRRLLTTSYDDTLRVWNFTPSSLASSTPFSDAMLKPKVSIPHDCQTGRWLSIFRAQWSSNVDYVPFFTVGNMKRSLDVFAGSGEIVARLFDPNVITAVPAVTAAHPSIANCVVGGNGSGKLQLWGRPE